MTALQQWLLYQLYVKNIFFNEELQEEIYMEQPPDFVAQEGIFWIGMSSPQILMASSSLIGLCLEN